MSFEIEKCIVCAAPISKKSPYPSPKANPLGFTAIENCGACGFGVAVPVVDQKTLDDFYGRGGYWHEQSSSAVLFNHQLVQAKERIRSVRAHLPKREGTLRVLDVGAGHAFIADALAEVGAGLEVEYSFFEPDERVAAASLSKKFDHVRIRRVSDLSAVGEDFDLIYLNQVLEHVAAPRSFLEFLKGRLAPSGVLYVEVPNRDDRFKSDVFPHTLFFSKNALEELSRDLSLRPVFIEEFGSWRSLRPSFWIKVISKLLNISVELGLGWLAQKLNRLLIGYGRQAGGIWIRGLFHA